LIRWQLVEIDSSEVGVIQNGTGASCIITISSKRPYDLLQSFPHAVVAAMEVECSTVFECELYLDYASAWRWYAAIWHRLQKSQPCIWPEEGCRDMGVVQIQNRRRKALEFAGRLVG
jgi:hypothetical protein